MLYNIIINLDEIENFPNEVCRTGRLRQGGSKEFWALYIDSLWWPPWS